MNQVYFYLVQAWAEIKAESSRRLNPFMNQVYFYNAERQAATGRRSERLNPFMNQVYFYFVPPPATP